MIKKIYFCGTMVGAYRNQNIVKYFGDRNYNIFLFDSSFFFLKFSKNKFLNVFIKIINHIINFLIIFPFKFIVIYKSDLIFIMAMSQYHAFDLVVAKILGKKIITDFYISQYDTAVLDRKEIKRKSFKGLFFKYLDKISIEYAKSIIFLNRSEQEYYIKLVQAEITKQVFQIIPLFSEGYQFNNIKIRKCSNRLHPQICWWGNPSPLHGLDKIFSAIRILKDQNYVVHLNILLPNFEKKASMRSLIEKYNIMEYVTVYDNLTFNNGKLPKFVIENCALALGIFGQSNKARTVIANKIIDAISFGIPVLTQETSGLKEYFTADKNIFFSSSDDENISKKIKNIFSQAQLLYRVSKNCKILYKREFSQIVLSKKMPVIMEGLNT